jgi:hypothetical protein
VELRYTPVTGQSKELKLYGKGDRQMKDYKRKGPLPANHPLAGGKTIIFGVNKPQIEHPQEDTTTPEEKAIIRAFVVWQQRQQEERLDQGLPLRSEEEFKEYMMAEKEKYYASLKGETANEPEKEQEENSGKTDKPRIGTEAETGSDQRDSESGVSSPDVYQGDTDSAGEGGELPDTTVGGGGSPEPDVSPREGNP